MGTSRALRFPDPTQRTQPALHTNGLPSGCPLCLPSPPTPSPGGACPHSWAIASGMAMRPASAETKLTQGFPSGMKTSGPLASQTPQTETTVTSVSAHSRHPKLLTDRD